ncbi:MAG TPA: histidine phosphatase family protein [Steroidobacteraceae bacterium]|jgi:broad specificity phosphatase PhoE|nr:histidine phosphatase family protein [Steroidobacteraceae bacterium]
MNIPGNLQRRPFFAPIGLLAVAVTAGLLVMIALVAMAWFLITSTPTTVIVVRHAAQLLGDGTDPPLSPEGEMRAATLAQTLGDTELKSRVAAIYVTSDLRSRSTAAPLAQRLRLTPEVVSEDDPRSLARHLLREHAGETTLVIGHAGTVPAIVSALSGEKDIPAVAGSDYSAMYVVTIPRIGRAEVLRENY